MAEQTNDSRVGELLAEKARLASAALANDAKAVKRVAAIDKEINELTWRSELEELAAIEEQRKQEEAAAAEEADRLADARSRYKGHGGSWKRIAATAQEQVEALRETLDELEEAYVEQRESALEAGEQQHYIDNSIVVNNWLTTHLRDHMPGSVAPPDPRYSKPLEELEPLPPSIDPPSEEEIATRDAALARSREEEERERRLTDQRTNAEVAAYEVLLPEMVFMDSITEERRAEVYERVAEAVRGAGPDLPEAMLQRVIDDAMRYFDRGGASEYFDETGAASPHRSFGVLDRNSGLPDPTPLT